jgi:polyhydroxyalkanoate synthase
MTRPTSTITGPTTEDGPRPEPVAPPEETAVVESGEPVAVPSVASLVTGVAATLGQGRALARETATLVQELARITSGSSRVAPAAKDRRFADPAWRTNPAYRRIGQSYLAGSAGLSRLVDELERGGADWHTVERARFAIDILTSAAAPTNTVAGNPAALKRAFDTGGASLLHGLGHWWDDLRHNGGMPSQTDRAVFKVGKDLAITPGGVVARSELTELLQYQPSTTAVRPRPVLIVPPPIGRHYFLDLRPGRSFVEYAVSRGLQVFMLVWRNPGPEHGHWDLDDYATAVVSAMDTIKEVTGAEDLNVLGFCAGGIITTTVLNHLAASGDHRVHSASFAVTLLDFGSRAPIGAFHSRGLLSLARWKSGRAGIITGRSLGQVFNFMRPDDLVFNYWVNNYLMGEDPPVFDILAWNADSTNLPAALHHQFLQIFEKNVLCRPGALNVLGTPMQLDQISVPTYVTGGITDHLTPWQGCYRTTQLIAGPSTFVLSNAGHIASLVNPPGNPKASYYLGGNPGSDPDEWFAGAQQRTGSWWENWADWVLERSGDEGPAPTKLGGHCHPVLDPAPGQYVRDLPPE